MSGTWTSERVDRLKKLWAEGESVSVIAADLGVSRNTVIGKVHRLGLEGRPKMPAAPGARKPRSEGQKLRRRLLDRQRLEVTRPRNLPGPIASADAASLRIAGKGAPTFAEPLPEPPASDREIPQTQRRTLIDLPFSGACKWPVGTPGAPDFFFCGGTTSTRPWGQSFCPYCDWHADRAVGNGTPSERRATEALAAEGAKANRAA